jgi:TP901 family phage tail tape measure protein
MNGKEYKLAIKISGEVEKSLDSSIKSVKKSLNSLKDIDSQFSTLDKGFDKVMSAGKKCFDAIVAGATAAATAIGLVTGEAISVGSEFESAFAGVKKTVDATEEEYNRLREGIIDMTREIPESAAAIAGVMEIAGQLGIANDSLLDFTETMINLGVSTNMTAEDAATNLAKFANIVAMKDFDENGVSNWERLGSTIVDLGNNFATTEEDLTLMAFRLASTGHLAGLSEAEILGLSTAMSAVGIRAEAGGSAMAKLLKKIQVAVETNSESLQDWADVAGMSAEEFSALWGENAVSALSAFIGGLNDTERNGKSAIQVLDDMGLKEVRLSNMILALAGSEGIMNDAVALANEAWGENTALVEEVNKRYETVESQAQLVKNAFEELGIQAYDEMRPMIVDALSYVKDSLNEIADSHKIHDFFKKLQGSFPTFKRVFTTNVSSVFETVKDIGQWLYDHGDKALGVVAGIASALVAYKLESSVVHGMSFIIEFFTKLNPVTGVLLGLVAAIGLFVGGLAAMAAEEEKLKNESLSEHFGNIVLDLKEVKQLAEEIAGGDYFRGIMEAFSQLEKADQFADAMADAQETIDKLNFKVSVGLNLDESDQQSYVTAIEEYINNAQEYVLQHQYAINIGLNTTLTDEQLNETNVVSILNDFYEGKHGELESIGKQLRDTVTNAFTDGLLDIDEVKEIQELQAQMAEIEESLTRSKNNAKLAMLSNDFKTSDLSLDSWKNVSEEAAGYIQEMNTASDEVIANMYAEVEQAYNDKIDAAVGPARIRQLQQKKQEALDAIIEGGAGKTDQAKVDLFNFDMDALTGAYSSEVKPTLDNIITDTQDQMKGMFDVEAALKGQDIPWGQIIHQLYYDMEDSLTSTLNTGDKAAAKEILKTMEPDAKQVEELIQKYRDTGQQIPEELINSILEYKTLKVMAGEGTESDLWSIVGEAIANDEQLSQLMTVLDEKGATVPEEISQAIIDNAGKVQEGVSELYSQTGDMVNSTFSAGFSVDCPVTINLVPTVNGGDIDVSSYVNVRGGNGGGGGTGGGNGGGNPGYATGGIVNFKQLAWIAEDGPEAVIPLDGSDNAMSLWQQAGKLLGIGSDGRESSVDTAMRGLEESDTGGTMEVTFAPQYTFNGDVNRQDLEEANAISFKQFEKFMDEYNKKQRRTKWA